MADLRGPGNKSPTNARFTPEEVRRVREELESGTAVSTLADEFGVTLQTIRNIRLGRTYAWVQ